MTYESAALFLAITAGILQAYKVGHKHGWEACNKSLERMLEERIAKAKGQL